MKEHKKANKKKYLKYFTNRQVFIVFFAVLQILFFALTTWIISSNSIYINLFLTLLTLTVVIYIINKPGNPSFKLAWVIPIMALPVFGGLFYIFARGQSSTVRFKKKLIRINSNTNKYLAQNEAISESFKKDNPKFALQSEYLYSQGNYPVYDDTSVKYYSKVEECFKDMLVALKGAESSIFIEYFIIHEGVMWNAMLDILKKKAKEGVDIRILYDGLGCIKTLPNKYEKKMEGYGIKCSVFNPYMPIISDIQNNRDHRKILVVDGKIAFTGGFNIADEYINEYERFGHWKDSAIMLTGKAVRTFSILFLQMWYLYNPYDTNISSYINPKKNADTCVHTGGYIQPYGDSPLTNERIGHNVYLNIINRADKYVYIITPYLIIDNELLNALMRASKSGIDVRIITPYKADKWYAHILTQAFYKELLESGVKIFEYTPGFIHAKQFVSDDSVAAVGTINLDYRSLYLHFECACLIYQNSAVGDIRDDFLKTQEMSQEITLQECQKINPVRHLCSQFLRLIAPLF